MLLKLPDYCERWAMIKARVLLTLNEVENSEITFLRVDSEHEVQRGVVAIDELCSLPPLRDDSFQVITEGIWSLRYLLKNALYHAFLCVLPDLACRVFVRVRESHSAQVCGAREVLKGGMQLISTRTAEDILVIARSDQHDDPKNVRKEEYVVVLSNSTPGKDGIQLI